MGGIHIAFRKSTGGSVYNAVSSDLTVPTSALAKYTSSGDGNVVPEFFHVFHKPNYYTIDAGVAYENNGYYRLFVNLNGAWKSGPLAAATGTKTLKTWFTNESGSYFINTQFGSVNQKESISSAMYNAFAGGCEIYREMVIASNGANTVPGDGYYKNAKFSNTTLTKTNGTYVAMSASNTTLVTNKLDNNIPNNWANYCTLKCTPSGINFVSDTTSGTFNKSKYPV